MEGPNKVLPFKWDNKFDVGDLTKLKIYVNGTDSFEARNLNIFTNYVLTFFDDKTIQKWLATCDMTFYQNQLNFAVWCASSGCGVSVSDHIKVKKKLLSSVYRFHIYYQSRKILEEMSCPIPGDSIFNTTDNRIDILKYQKLCNEFSVKTNTDFRFKGGDNGGLGTMYNYATNLGYRSLKGAVYNSERFKFIPQSSDGAIKIDYVKQDLAIEGWKQFLLEKSGGFTRTGLVRLDDSIRTYVYCILGSQAQTRSSILSSAETQQYFTDLLEKNIRSQFSIPESITQYQNSITNTNSRIDYVVGIGLYMIPSNLVLKLSSLEGYNNNIVIADKSLKIGYNENINQEVKAKVSIPTQTQTQVESVVESGLDKESSPQINNIYLYLGITGLVFGVCYLFLR